MKQQSTPTHLISITFLLFIVLITFISSCESGSPCDTIECINGRCAIDTMGNPICSCFDGWKGVTCETPSCSEVDCGTNGTCIIGAEGVPICDCEGGWTGVNCEEQDLCFNVSCPATGVCIEGECSCLPYYEGDDCVPMRDKFLGNYNNGNSACPTPEDYDLEIVEDPDDISKIILKNFHAVGGPGTEISASIIASTSMIIPYQTDDAGVIFKSTNTGRLSGNTLTIEYKVEQEDGNLITCTLTMTKQ